MNVVKVFKRTEGNEKNVEKVRGAKQSKKNVQQPAKAKKAEGTKKPPKKSDETPVVIAWWHHARQYLREVGYELRKVVWPSRKETIGSTSVVLVIVLLTGIFLGLADMIVSHIMRIFIG